MKWDHLNDRQKSIQIINLLRLLSLSDGVLNHSELNFIREVGVSHGMSIDDVDNALVELDNTVIMPTSEQDRMSLMYYMIFMMKADKHLGEDEEKLIYHYGFKLGFRESLMREFIKLAKQYLHTGIPVKEMLDKIKKFMN